MPFDFKKEFKEQYAPKHTPMILTMPKAKYVAIKGKGNPNEIDGDYTKAVQTLYTVAYTLKMSYKSPHQIKGFFDYVVPPLEGLWWQEGIKGVDYAHKETFSWISLIRVPDFINEEEVNWAKETALKKKGIDCSKLFLFEYDEGLCVQIMHMGSYDDEPATVEKMHEYMIEQGYELEINESRHHHEIYLSDPRKVEVSKLKTLIRHPIKQK